MLGVHQAEGELRTMHLVSGLFFWYLILLSYQFLDIYEYLKSYMRYFISLWFSVVSSSSTPQ